MGAATAAAHGCVLLPAPAGLPTESAARDYVDSLWQVSGALIGVAFAVFLFELEATRKFIDDDFVWDQLQVKSFLYPAVAVLVGTIAAGGAGSLMLLPSGGLPTPPGLGNLLIVDSVLFVLSLAALLQLYNTLIEFLRPSYIEEFKVVCARDIAERNAESVLRQQITEHLLAADCAHLGMAFYRGTTNWPGMVPYGVRHSGTVVDIDRQVLREMGAALPQAQPHSAVVAIGIGSRLRAQATVAILAPPNMGDEFIALVQRCFKVKS